MLAADAGGDFLARRREQEPEHLTEIERRFGGVPRVHLPMVPRDITDRDALEALIRVLRGHRTPGAVRQRRIPEAPSGEAPGAVREGRSI